MKLVRVAVLAAVLTSAGCAPRKPIRLPGQPPETLPALTFPLPADPATAGPQDITATSWGPVSFRKPDRWVAHFGRAELELILPATPIPKDREDEEPESTGRGGSSRMVIFAGGPRSGDPAAWFEETVRNVLPAGDRLLKLGPVETAKHADGTPLFRQTQAIQSHDGRMVYRTFVGVCRAGRGDLLFFETDRDWHYTSHAGPLDVFFRSLRHRDPPAN